MAQSPSTKAGKYVKEEIHHIREGKHGARSTKQAIAIGLSKARRKGVKLPAPKKGRASATTRRKARQDAFSRRETMGLHIGSIAPDFEQDSGMVIVIDTKGETEQARKLLSAAETIAQRRGGTRSTERVAGEDVIVSRNGKPLVRITRLGEAKRRVRFGVLKGKVKIAKDFDAPLPARVLADFEGG